MVTFPAEASDAMPLKVPERLDRPTFWQWAICLVLGHIVLALLTATGGMPFGGLDTLAILALALVRGARFRDIGWPVWIGPTFMLVTMLALPLVALGYAIASSLSPPELLKLMNGIGLFTAPANLLLLIVTGSVPAAAAANSTEAAAPVVMSQASALAPDMISISAAAPSPDLSQASSEATSLPSAAPAGSGRTDLLVAGGAGLIIMLIVGGVIVHAVSLGPANTARPNPPAGYLESNGLTKDTNDFLRQLSRQQPARR
jgi:hypothetical protein